MHEITKSVFVHELAPFLTTKELTSLGFSCQHFHKLCATLFKVRMERFGELTSEEKSMPFSWHQKSYSIMAALQTPQTFHKRKNTGPIRFIPTTGSFHGLQRKEEWLKKASWIDRILFYFGFYSYCRAQKAVEVAHECLAKCLTLQQNSPPPTSLQELRDRSIRLMNLHIIVRYYAEHFINSWLVPQFPFRLINVVLKACFIFVQFLCYLPIALSRISSPYILDEWEDGPVLIDSCSATIEYGPLYPYKKEIYQIKQELSKESKSLWTRRILLGEVTVPTREAPLLFGVYGRIFPILQKNALRMGQCHLPLYPLGGIYCSLEDKNIPSESTIPDPVGSFYLFRVWEHPFTVVEGDPAFFEKISRFSQEPLKDRGLSGTLSVDVTQNQTTAEALLLKLIQISAEITLQQKAAFLKIKIKNPIVEELNSSNNVLDLLFKEGTTIQTEDQQPCRLKIGNEWILLEELIRTHPILKGESFPSYFAYNFAEIEGPKSE